MSDVTNGIVTSSLEEPTQEPVGGATPEPVEETSPEASTPEPQVEDLTPADEETPETPEVEEWKPDFKVKVMDKELEWNPHIQKIVTKENFAELKELHEKAYGLPHVKERLNAAKEENKSLKKIKEEYDNMNQAIDMLNKYRANGDLHSFFQALQIPEKEIMKYSLDRANYYGMSAEQKQQYEANLQSTQRLSQLEQQNQLYQQQMNTQMAEARGRELDMYLGRQDIKPIVDSYDTRVGTPGAFREEVIRRGQIAYYSSQVDLPVAEAVDQVIKFAGLNQAMQQNTSQMPGQQQGVNVVHQGNQNKPVIPSIKGGAQSPARKVISSTDELIEKYQQLQRGL